MSVSPSRRRTQGPDSALAELFERHYHRVLAAAFRVTGNRQDAEDVLQTVFLRLTRRARGGAGETSGPYVRRAAVNAAIDLLRTRARAGLVALDDVARGEVADESEVSPERRLRDGEIRRRLRQALAGLPERSARVFAMRYFEGARDKEIARLLGMSPITVRVTLHRARKRLQSTMRELARGEQP